MSGKSLMEVKFEINLSINISAMRKEKEITERESFVPPSNAEEGYSRKEQFLDSGFRD
jgi:hypothetical protein